MKRLAILLALVTLAACGSSSSKPDPAVAAAAQATACRDVIADGTSTQEAFSTSLSTDDLAGAASSLDAGAASLRKDVVPLAPTTVLAKAANHLAEIFGAMSGVVQVDDVSKAQRLLVPLKVEDDALDLECHSSSLD